MKNNILLGVNIDHIATLRQARGESYPCPVTGALMAELAGADGITLHPREDARHIQRRDVEILRDCLKTRMNLEMAVTEDMLQFAEKIKPQHVCFVPEKRQEITTEGGLDVIGHFSKIKEATQRLQALNIEVSLFIDADAKQIESSHECGTNAIELHTGDYANAKDSSTAHQKLALLQASAKLAHEANLIVNAGHGLNYHNVKPIAAITEINELNIGHAIISQALFCGIDKAVRDMRLLMSNARQ